MEKSASSVLLGKVNGHELISLHRSHCATLSINHAVWVLFYEVLKGQIIQCAIKEIAPRIEFVLGQADFTIL